MEPFFVIHRRRNQTGRRPVLRHRDARDGERDDSCARPRLRNRPMVEVSFTPGQVHRSCRSRRGRTRRCPPYGVVPEHQGHEGRLREPAFRPRVVRFRVQPRRRAPPAGYACRGSRGSLHVEAQWMAAALRLLQPRQPWRPAPRAVRCRRWLPPAHFEVAACAEVSRLRCHRRLCLRPIRTCSRGS